MSDTPPPQEPQPPDPAAKEAAGEPVAGEQPAGGRPLEWGWQLGIAVVLLTIFVIVALVMIIDPGDPMDGTWERRVYIFGSLEAIVFTAVGWIFGREVHRAGAQQARQDAAEAKGDAKAAQEEAKEQATEAAKAQATGAQLAAGLDVFEASAAGAGVAAGGAGDVGPVTRGRSKDAGLSGDAGGGSPAAGSADPQLAALMKLRRRLYPD